MSEHPPPSEGPAPPALSTAQRARRSALFVVVVGGVLAVFVILGRQSTPPTMPASAPHKLRFNLKGELIGVEGEAGLEAALQPGFVLEKKAVEKRVNTTCLACHGGPGDDLSAHACQTVGRCLPPHHPPKSECIKCHRMPSTR
jgi:cytochrome c553